MLSSSEGHPVITQQRAMRGDFAAAPAGPAVGNGSVLDFSPDFSDPRVSRFVGGLVLGAALTVFALRLAGFRFSFGASVGAG